jgi:2-(1,2-epoxy-1,2-dihydrophenyl)acetyl-CoA isomerase
VTLGAVVKDGVVTITIDNFEARNALDNPTRQALLAALRDADSDAGCIAIVLTGAGNVFCAGGELSSMPTEDSAVRQRVGEMQDIVRLIHAGAKPVVAAVDGAAYGSGLSLAVASDLVIATDHARFGCTFGKVGLVADTGLLWTLPRRTGWPEARKMLLEGRQIDAKEAAAIGIVDEIVPSDDLLFRAEAWASAFSTSAPMALAATKRLLAHPGGTLEELLDAELDAQAELLAGRDFAEGRSAFFEKRVPNFR